MREFRLEDYLDRVPAPPAPDDLPPGEDTMLVELPPRNSTLLSAALHQQWAMVLLMALRDRAAEVHYHPRRPRGGLWYLIDEARYGIVPPPVEFVGDVLETGRSLFAGLPSDSGHKTVCSTVCVWYRNAGHVWDAVCWSSGDRVGIDLYFIGLLPPYGPL